MSRGIRAGILAALPLSPGIVAVGAVVGALAIRCGLSPVESVVLSLIVFAGTAQIAALEVLERGGGAVEVVAAGLVMSLRYLAYGAALAPSLGRIPGVCRGLLAYLLTDTMFAVSARIPAHLSPAERASFAGAAGAVAWLAWQGGVLAGSIAGAAGIPPLLATSVPLLIVGLATARLRSAPEVVCVGVTAGLALALGELPGGWLLAAAGGTAAGGLAWR